jgi:hypothetical protein
MIFVEDKKRRKELALYQSNVVLEALFVMAVARGNKKLQKLKLFLRLGSTC